MVAKNDNPDAGMRDDQSPVGPKTQVSIALIFQL
jgi:hypothetical protein